MPLILPTKIYIPPVRENAVARPRLFQKLSDGLSRPLTLISAPAGFGKSSLVSGWYEQSQGQFSLAWISLDSEDNEPARFLAYLATACGRMQAGVGESLLAVLDASQPLDPRTALGLFIRDLSDFAGPGVLVLDDYHTITNAEIQDLVGYLVNNLPAGLHLIIATRADPPLPLGRLRVSDRLVEIRAADLIFRPDEVEAFLSQTMGLSLGKAAVNRLAGQTEGWAAGLQLAALAARSEGIQALEAGFGGESPYLLEYLVEEVLAHLPERQQEFLLQTAVLEELCGPLCDAVAQRQDSGRLLEALYRANLFLIPLGADATGQKTFRYHHLFAESLVTRLKQMNAAVVPQLYGRAARWYAGENRMETAIRYALQAGETGAAADWIETVAPEYLKNGRAAPVRHWLEQLGDGYVRSHTGLALIGARCLYMTGDFARCQILLDELEQRLLAEDDRAAPARLGQVYTMRGNIESIGSNWRATIADAQRALAILPEQDGVWRSVAALSLGTAMLMEGDLPGSDEAYILAVEESLRVGNLNTAFTALTNRAQNRILSGRLREAEDLLQQGVRIIRDLEAEKPRLPYAGQEAGRFSSIRLVPTASLIYCTLVDLRIERRELDAAEGFVQQALELAHQGGFIVVIIAALTARAQLELARGHAEQALTWVDQAIQTVQGPKTSGLLNPLIALRARLQLELGNLPAVARLAEELAPTEDENESPHGADLSEAIELVLLRLYRAQGQAERGLQTAQRMLRTAEAGFRLTPALEIRLQMALLHRQLGDHGAAIQALREALAFGFSRGFRNTFLAAGPEIRPLLQSFLRGLETGDPIRDAARQILAAFPLDSEGESTGEAEIAANRNLPPARPAAQRANNLLVEPLSERELDVLRRVAQGASNQEIAGQLVVSLGTVKSHVHHIQGKLGTRSRVELVQRAKDLGLV